MGWIMGKQKSLWYMKEEKKKIKHSGKVKETMKWKRKLNKKGDEKLNEKWIREIAFSDEYTISWQKTDVYY